MLAAAVMRDGHRGGPFARLALALVGAAQVCLHGNPLLPYLLQIAMRGLGIMAGAEQPPLLYVAPMTGGIAPEIPEIANAFKRQDTIFHVRAASAALRARLP